jgi:hypothetical protein
LKEEEGRKGTKEKAERLATKTPRHKVKYRIKIIHEKWLKKKLKISSCLRAFVAKLKK